MNIRYLRAEELARLAGVAKSTVLAAIRRGEIPSSRTVGRGTRIAVETARVYLESRGRTVPHELRDERPHMVTVISENEGLPERIRSLASTATVSGSPRAYAALVAIGAESPQLVVVDLSLSLLNPFEVIREIRSFGPSTRIVAVGENRALFDAALAMGASEVVDPSDGDALTRILAGT